MGPIRERYFCGMGGDYQATQIIKELIQLGLSVTCPRDHLFLRQVYCKSDFKEIMRFCFPELSPTCDMQSYNHAVYKVSVFQN